MECLHYSALNAIGGGSVVFSQGFDALNVSLQIYQGNFDSLEQATKAYAQIGQALSAAIFTALHPDAQLLGKMRYTIVDFE